MNKDALLATLIGFGIGLFITGVLILGPNLTKFLPKIQLPTFSLPTKNAGPTPTPTPGTFSLTIDSPLTDNIENTADILVSGTAQPGSTVIIAGALDEAVVVVGEDGKYAGKIKLTEGKNDITVTSILKEEKSTQSVTVFYTPEEI